MSKKILFMIAETPIHAGMGQDVGVVDLPIQREVHTRLPRIQASGVKGSIRSAVKGMPNEEEIFGPEEVKGNDNAKAGEVFFTDARILVFPVRVLGSMFAWITSPYVLSRYLDLLKHTGKDDTLEIPEIDSSEKVFVTTKENNEIVINNKVVIGDIAYTAEVNQKLSNIANQIADDIYKDYAYLKNKFIKHLILVSDEEFVNLTETKTEVITRVRLEDQKKKIQQGALWTEEALPAETVLFSLVGLRRKNSEKYLEELERNLNCRMQIGGNETVGYGQVRLIWK